MSDKKPEEKPEQSEKKEGSSPAIVTKILAAAKSSAKFVQKVSEAKVIQNTKSKILAFGLNGWMKVLGGIAIAGLTFIVYKTAPNWKSFWKIPYLSTFESVANKKFSYNTNDEVIRYDNDLLLPQHVVLINKIVVNIRSSKQSTDNPMVAFDLYVKTDNEEAAVEIKEREKQLQDHLQRFCESLQYDQIQTEEGKLLWKNRMRRELNLVLNTGKVKQVFFKTLLIKR